MDAGVVEEVVDSCESESVVIQRPVVGDALTAQALQTGQGTRHSTSRLTPIGASASGVLGLQLGNQGGDFIPHDAAGA